VAGRERDSGAQEGRWPWLRSRLFLKYLAIIVSLVGAAVLATSLVALWFTQEQARDEVTTVERTAAGGIRDSLHAQLGQAVQDAQAAATGGARGASLAEVRDELVSFVNPQYRFTDVSYVDPAGVERVRVSRDSKGFVGEGRRLANDPLFRATQAGTVAYGPIEVRTSGFGRQVVMTIAVPRTIDGGAIFAQLDLVGVQRQVADLAATTPGYAAYLVDDRGVVAAHSDPRARLDGRSVADRPQVRRALAGDLPDDAVSGRSSGDEVLSYALRMTPPGWLLFVEQPRDEAFGPVSSAIQRTIVLVVLSLVLAAIAAAILARRLVRPIRTIRAGAARIAGGHLDERIEIRSGDELGALADEFNRMAEQLEATYATLERRVEERTVELRQSLEANAVLLEELEAKTREVAAASHQKSAFLANMSHELRTPLNAVIGFSEVLRDRLFGPLSDKQAEYLDDIHASGKHLLALINDVLDLAKIEAGRGELELSDMDIRLCLEQGVGMIRERAARGGVDVRLDAPDDLGTVRADERRVKQVVVNLLANAVKFTPELGRVEVVARREADSVRVTVRDTGVGIAPEDQERVFEEFEQATTPEAREGTGLGLSLARRFIEAHEGRLTMESVLGEGSAFTFTLPVAGPARAAEPAPTAEAERALPPEPLGGRDLVLVVEDDPRAAKLQAVHLGEAGFDVVVAGSAEEGLEAARRLHPAVVTLDVLMPGRDGWDFIAEAKGDPGIAEIPIVVVSIVDEPLRGFALGAVDYLVKPVSGPRLVSAVARALVSGPRRPQVLVVDDDPSARALARAVLEPGGFEVSEAGDGRSGLDAVRRRPPDLVVLDLLMPDVDGFAFVDELRSDPGTAGVPVVVLTSASLSPAERELLNARVSHLAQKGELDRERFVELVRRLCPEAVPS
jgi:signal transduction histidine kinase/DNA-binding response OmpR family regulator